MTALTGPIETGRKDGAYVAYPVAAGQKIYKGALLVTRLDGNAYNLRTPAASQPDVFIGIADETVDNTSGANGALLVHVLKTGSYQLAMPGVTVAAIGSAVYGADNATLTATSTNAVLIGYVSEYVDSNDVRVRIDRAIQ
jgi:hypothetical protein